MFVVRTSVIVAIIVGILLLFSTTKWGLDGNSGFLCEYSRYHLSGVDCYCRCRQASKHIVDVCRVDAGWQFLTWNHIFHFQCNGKSRSPKVTEKHKQQQQQQWFAFAEGTKGFSRRSAMASSYYYFCFCHCCGCLCVIYTWTIHIQVWTYVYLLSCFLHTSAKQRVCFCDISARYWFKP